ncbi:MAG: hypothetical protein IT291_00585 [Deltaproteobacteria bacterium]|nr:hypothetical protein [Deltaproteobacteria bacterium]
MEKVDRELIAEIAPSNPRLQELYEEHVALEKELRQYQGLSEYSPEMAIRKRELKKQKLKGMDDIMGILAEHRRGCGCEVNAS